jgi:hypothetical protein
MSDLQRAFDAAVLDQIKRTRKEVPGYTPSYFGQMVAERGGVQATRDLLQPTNRPHSGYTRLWMADRLDLTVEYLVAKDPRWTDLFTEAERAEARKRLDDVS